MLLNSMLAALALIAASAAGAVDTATWQYQAAKDDFDSQEYHSISIGSQPGSQAAVLTLQCAAGKSPLFVFRTDDVLSSDGDGLAKLQLSVDGKPIKGLLANTWQRSETYQGATTYAVKAILGKLEGGSVLRVRVQGVLQQFDSAFALDSLQVALAQLKPHCKGL